MNLLVSLRTLSCISSSSLNSLKFLYTLSWKNPLSYQKAKWRASNFFYTRSTKATPKLDPLVAYTDSTPTPPLINRSCSLPCPCAKQGTKAKKHQTQWGLQRYESRLVRDVTVRDHNLRAVSYDKQGLFCIYVWAKECLLLKLANHCDPVQGVGYARVAARIRARMPLSYIEWL